MIEIAGVSHYFKSKTTGGAPLPVLDDVSVTILDGTFVSFLGPSGCGKTTLLRIVDGLIWPTSGEVFVDGKLVRHPGPDRAMVFQEFNLLPWRTVRANVELGLELQGVGQRDRARQAQGAIELVGLGEFGHFFPHELSGGMKQLVGFARALCTAPRTLLMDEPFGSLDSQTREIMQLQLTRIWEQDRKSVVFVTHSVEEAIFLSDRIVVLSSRPARVLDIVEIDLGRPRWPDGADVRGDAAFLEYRRRIWEVLQHELRPLIALAGSRSGGG